MSDDRGGSSGSGPSARIEELKDRVDRAAALISELRETNDSLSSEVAELKSQLTAGDTRGSSEGSGSDSDAAEAEQSERGGSAAASSGNGEVDPALAAELELLRKERRAVRKKLESLIERIEKLDP